MLTQPSAHIQFATEELSVNGVKYVNHLKLVQAEANIVELQKEKVQLPNLLTMALLEAKQNAERVVELQGRLFSVEAKLEAIDQKLDLRAMTEALEKAVLCTYTKKKIRNLAELLKSTHGLDQEDTMFLTELVPLFDSLKADGSSVAHGDRLKSPADEYENVLSNIKVDEYLDESYKTKLLELAETCNFKEQVVLIAINEKKKAADIHANKKRPTNTSSAAP